MGRSRSVCFFKQTDTDLDWIPSITKVTRASVTRLVRTLTDAVFYSFSVADQPSITKVTRASVTRLVRTLTDAVFYSFSVAVTDAVFYSFSVADQPVYRLTD